MARPDDYDDVRLGALTPDTIEAFRTWPRRRIFATAIVVMKGGRKHPVECEWIGQSWGDRLLGSDDFLVWPQTFIDHDAGKLIRLPVTTVREDSAWSERAKRLILAHRADQMAGALAYRRAVLMQRRDDLVREAMVLSRNLRERADAIGEAVQPALWSALADEAVL
jgi:hypothetical protein